MQADKPAALQSRINVTPLVDVVLVLLIIFMVMAPQLATGPTVNLPETDRPDPTEENATPIRVTLEPGGRCWVESRQLEVSGLLDELRALPDHSPQVVIQGDAALSYGEVRDAMLAAKQAGFRDVALITRKRNGGG